MRRFGASALVVLGGLIATLTTFLLLTTSEIDGAERQFALWTKERQQVLQKEIDAHIQVLHGVRALFDSSEHVTAEEFDRYTAGFLDRYEHMYSLEWLPRVGGEDRAQFEERASRELGVDYRIRARTPDRTLIIDEQRPDYWPILYSQARDDLARLGLNAAFRPENRAAMGIAARTGEPSAAHIQIPPTAGAPGDLMIIYVPVLDQQRVGRVVGFVRTSLSIDEVMRGVLRDAAAEGIAVELIDETEGKVLTSLRAVGGPRLRQPTRMETSAAMQAVHRLRLADRPLELRFSATPAYVGRPRLTPAFVLLAVGLLVTALGAIAAIQLTHRRLHLQALTHDLLREVAERRHSEQRLAQSEARYRVVVENSPDAIVLHRNGIITFANDACVRMLRANSADDLVGRSILELAHESSHGVVKDRLRALQSGMPTPLPAAEHKLKRLDGSMIDVEVLSVPYETDEGVMVQVTARDITQRKAAEAERQTLEAALRQSQKLEAVGTLAGGIAHDFNNILSAIIGNARLLLDELPEAHSALRSVREIRAAAHRARELVKRLTAFSRQQESQRSPVALPALITEVQHLLRATMPAGIDLTIRVPPETPSILADATQIHQVLLNLCTNAWQAMQTSTGRIEINVETLSQDAAREDSGQPLEDAACFVRLGVHDNGAGMTPDVLEHIFEPFFTTKQTGEGSGLGLAVVHGIVTSHKGAITVKSRPGEGSSFFVYLPACESAPAPALATTRQRARGAAEHIMYIDDEEPLVVLAARMLERAGFHCTGKTSAAEAIDLVRAAPQDVDFVVTDLNMPGMSGLDVARELLSIRSDLPVIITTGYVRAQDVAAARAAGVREVVLKPDTIDELAALVQKHLESMRREA